MPAPTAGPTATPTAAPTAAPSETPSEELQYDYSHNEKSYYYYYHHNFKTTPSYYSSFPTTETSDLHDEFSTKAPSQNAMEDEEFSTAAPSRTAMEYKDFSTAAPSETSSEELEYDHSNNEKSYYYYYHHNFKTTPSYYSSFPTTETSEAEAEEKSEAEAEEKSEAEAEEEEKIRVESAEHFKEMDKDMEEASRAAHVEAASYYHSVVSLGNIYYSSHGPDEEMQAHVDAEAEEKVNVESAEHFKEMIMEEEKIMEEASRALPASTAEPSLEIGPEEVEDNTNLDPAGAIPVSTAMPYDAEELGQGGSRTAATQPARVGSLGRLLDRYKADKTSTRAVQLFGASRFRR
jgi:hypothetical protein